MWVHDLDPFLIRFSQNFGIRWYGLAYLTGFILGGLFCNFMFRRGRDTIKQDDIMDFVTYIIFGTMIGGRVGYAVFYSQDLLTGFSSSFPFWDLLKVWEGGMASHGGILGVGFACLLFAKRRGYDWRHLGDLTVIGGAIGIFFGRIANFINGELFGRPVESDVAWAVKFPSEMYLWLKTGPGSDPAQNLTHLQKVTDAVVVLGQRVDEWRTALVSFGSSASRIEISHHIDRLIDAVQSGNAAVVGALAPALTSRHPSQLYEALLEGLLLFLVAFFFWYKPRKPGVVGSLWLTVYAVVRVIGEQYRMPDQHIGYQLLGLTRGQWISIGMFFIALGLLIWTSRRQVPVVAGWGPTAQSLRAEQAAPKRGRKG